MRREIKIILNLIGSLWLAMPLYLLLHEGGHALVATLCQAQIIEFNILEAYVVVEGGHFNEMTLALFYVAGMMIPTLFWIGYLIFYKRDTIHSFYRIFSALFSGMVLFSIGVWIVIPIKYMLNQANPNDDVTQFIEVLKIKPVTVTIGASLLIGICMFGAWRKCIFQNGYKAIKSSLVE